jgi:hypothetical protein
VQRFVKLRENVVIEPLVMGWHAWSHLVSPATFALNIQFRYLPLLDSFISNPAAHATACQTPSLRGGPFVDLPIDSVNEVKALIDDTKYKCKNLIEFADSLRQSFRHLIKSADGYSIEPLYKDLPEHIRGYVEFNYTVAGYPDLYINESLLYKSQISSRRLQSALMYAIKDDHRPFALSTPRLNRSDAINLPFSFDSDVYDFLAQLRFKAQPINQVVERLGLTSDQMELFESLVQDCDPDEIGAPTMLSGKTRWRYFGHACVLIESPQGHSVLVDPIISYCDNGGLNRFTLADLPESIDYVVLTHNHADHVLIETLLAIRHKVKCVAVPRSGDSLVDPSLRLMLMEIGFENVVELSSLESVDIGDLKLTALPFLGEHGDLDIRTKAAWLVTIQGQNFLFAADSNNLDPEVYRMLRGIFGAIQNLFIGMECLGAPFSWSYGPYLPIAIDRKKDQSRRLNGSDFSRGMEVVDILGAERVYVYAMGAEPWIQFITSIDPAEDTVPRVNAKQLISACQVKNIHAELLYCRSDFFP